MALTNQPYLPLYVDDYLSDEKLNQCEPSSEGIYIRIMGMMHKSKDYGSIELTPFDEAKHEQKVSKLKANEKQTELIKFLDCNADDFYLMACKVQTMIGRDLTLVVSALIDLVGNDVLQFTNKILVQKRMKKDGEKSKIRANAGAKGGKKEKQTLSKKEAKAKQIPVNGNVIVNENVDESENEDKGGAGEKIDPNKIIGLYHQFCKDLPKVAVLNKSRKATIKARINEHGVNTVTQVFQLAGQSNFLLGNNDKNWNATFDWIMKPTNFVKVLEGNYNDKKNNTTTQYQGNR
jgi:uncharacterized protein YdaU (DUF1376 family)